MFYVNGMQFPFRVVKIVRNGVGHPDFRNLIFRSRLFNLHAPQCPRVVAAADLRNVVAAREPVHERIRNQGFFGIKPAAGE